MTDRVIVPDLEPPAPGVALRTAATAPASPVRAAIALAASALEEAAHLGLAHLPASFAGRAAEAAARLDATGLRAAARRLERLRERVHALRDDAREAPLAAAASAWMDAAIRVELTREAESITLANSQ